MQNALRLSTLQSPPRSRESAGDRRPTGDGRDWTARTTATASSRPQGLWWPVETAEAAPRRPAAAPAAGRGDPPAWLARAAAAEGARQPGAGPARRDDPPRQIDLLRARWEREASQRGAPTGRAPAPAAAARPVEPRRPANDVGRAPEAHASAARPAFPAREGSSSLPAGHGTGTPRPAAWHAATRPAPRTAWPAPPVHDADRDAAGLRETVRELRRHMETLPTRADLESIGNRIADVREEMHASDGAREGAQLNRTLSHILQRLNTLEEASATIPRIMRTLAAIESRLDRAGPEPARVGRACARDEPEPAADRRSAPRRRGEDPREEAARREESGLFRRQAPERPARRPSGPSEMSLFHEDPAPLPAGSAARRDRPSRLWPDD